MIRILFLAANPSHTTRLAVDREVREITQRLRATPHGDEFDFVQEWAVRVSDLQAALLRHRPQILHFSGHGSGGPSGGPSVGASRDLLPDAEGSAAFEYNAGSGILVEDEAGHAVAISPSSLGDLLRIVGGIRCVILNACHSAEQAEAIRQHADRVVAMRRTLDDRAAIAFSWAFYQGLGHGEPIETAFELGKQQIGMSSPGDTDVPILLSKDSSKDGHARGPLALVQRIPEDERWVRHNVRGALRVLTVAPAGSERLQRALAEPIAEGEIEWLDPIEGPAARGPSLFDRLNRKPIPHVLHVLGRDGERWWSVEDLAQQLKANVRNTLRVIVLESGEGAGPSAFAAAAEDLVRAGVDAVVVARLGSLEAPVAHACIAALYRALAGKDRVQGDIALSVNEARREIPGAIEGSAEATSLVVHLRGPDSVLFDFHGRKVVTTRSTMTVVRTQLDLSLARLVQRPFTLLLGDRLKEQQAALVSFRDKLHKELVKVTAPAAPDLPMSALTQRYVLHRGAEKLNTEFQKTFRILDQVPPRIESLARIACPGVHATLLRLPWFELALAELQPERTLYVVQPRGGGIMITRREAGGEEWEELNAPPAAFDPEEDILLLRLFGGYTPELVFAQPLLTEDDYALGLRELEGALPRDLVNAINGTLSYRPVLIVGASMYTAHHRMLLHRIYPRGLPPGSVAVLDPEQHERKLWERGTGLPGKNEGVGVVELQGEHLDAALAGEGAS